MQMAEKYSAKHSDKYLIKPPRRAVSYRQFLFLAVPWRPAGGLAILNVGQGTNPEMIE